MHAGECHDRRRKGAPEDFHCSSATMANTVPPVGICKRGDWGAKKLVEPSESGGFRRHRYVRIDRAVVSDADPLSSDYRNTCM